MIHISRHFDQIRGSIICDKHGPIQIDLHFTLATHLSTRSDSDLVLCCRVRLPATSLHYLVHRRPGQKCAGRAFHAKGMHHEVVHQLCRRQIIGLAGRPSYGLLKEVDRTGKPFGRNHGERVPGGQVRSSTPCGRDVRRDRPVRTNRGAVPVC